MEARAAELVAKSLEDSIQVATIEEEPIVEEAVVEPLPIVEEVAAELIPIVEEPLTIVKGVEVKLDKPINKD